MNILVACEYSGVVRDAFIARGHNAVSCDLLPSERPGPHYLGDVRVLVKYCPWDMIIAFPPCTDLAAVGARTWGKKQANGQQRAAAEFFMMFLESDVEKVAVENPVGWMNTNYRKPDQIIEPYYFGDPWRKKTCLWLKGLSPLTYGPKMVTPTGRWVDGENFHKTGDNVPDHEKMNRKERAHHRARTFQGIADAMAEQWG